MDLSKSPTFQFNDKTIQTLFGFEDAESEIITRLRQYYFKSAIFERVTAELPIRVLVGHKGTGKSALFKVAIDEDRENQNLPILIKPDDIAELGKTDENFLLRIRQWKHGLIRIIGAKVLSEFGLYDDGAKVSLTKFGIKLITFLSETASKVKENIDLNPAQQLAIQQFLKNKKIIIYLDDLDRGWQGKKDDIVRISALLNAIRDLANENEGISFKVSLRSDVYYLVRTSDESTDKIEGSVVWLKWTNQEIFLMLIKRIKTFFGDNVNETQLRQTPNRHLSYELDRIFEHKFLGMGAWNNVSTHRVLMSLTRKRPRDLVKVCSLAAQKAREEKTNLIKSSHIEGIFEEYSQGRIQDTVNEYKSELPKIEKLLFGMKPNKKQRKASDGFVYTTPELMTKINSIMQMNNFSFASKRLVTAKELAHFLYKINFLTAKKVMKDGTIKRKYFEENRYLSKSIANFGYDWEVHPAFRFVLQPDEPHSIYY